MPRRKPSIAPLRPHVARRSNTPKIESSGNEGSRTENEKTENEQTESEKTGHEAGLFVRLLVRSLHSEQFDVEHQSRVRRDHAAGAAGAVAELRRDDQRALAANLHRGNALVPAG